MPVKSKESGSTFSPASIAANWARQGIETFMAAQKIMLDLAAQQNSLVIGMVRERLSHSQFKPGDTLAAMADRGVQNFTTAGKILLDLAAGETAVVVDGVKNVLPVPPAGTLANLVRHRVVTLIEMQKRWLEATAEQTHVMAESFRGGKGIGAVGDGMAELARRGVENLVETEKKFLDLAAHEVKAAGKNGDHERMTASERYETLTQLVREGGEICIEAQKKLLRLATDEMKSMGETAGERVEAARHEARTSWSHLSEKSVKNVVAAEKSLMDIVAKKPMKETESAPAAEKKRRAPRPRPKAKAAAAAAEAVA